MAPELPLTPELPTAPDDPDDVETLDPELAPRPDDPDDPEDVEVPEEPDAASELADASAAVDEGELDPHAAMAITESAASAQSFGLSFTMTPWTREMGSRPGVPGSEHPRPPVGLAGVAVGSPHAMEQSRPSDHPPGP